MNQPPDPFEFLKNLWGPMGLPPAGVMAPTLGQDVLRATLHGLEMQKSGLAAMRDAAAMGNKAQDPAGDRPAAPAEEWSDVPQPGREGPSKK